MERESFEDEEVAQLLNDHFIAIKVDREERPDIDHIYMNYCQATTGHGGWPLSIFMTPEQKPFYAGTYFPKKSKYGYTGFMDVLTALHRKWERDYDEVVEIAGNTAKMLDEMEYTFRDAPLKEAVFDRTYNELKRNFDRVYGGFGKAPKFPTPHNLLYLLRYYKAKGTPDALKMVEETLERMYKGGIFDHLGGGFSRYSTDQRWLIPHFEKMLYDNALLLMAYAECYQVTKRPVYKEVAEKTLTYLLRDMVSPQGGFYSAEDADSEGQEGKFYVWSIEEVEKLLTKEDAKLFCETYDVTGKGNFEGKNILNLIEKPLEEIDADEEVKKHLESLKDKLFHVREARVHPYKDDKILTSWNGLMIGAMAICGKVFKESRYIESAERAFTFFVHELVDEHCRIYTRYRDGERKHLGYLDDYAFMIWGCIELYEATFETKYLVHADTFTKAMIDLFSDEVNTGFFLYGKDGEQLILKPKEIYDGAMPSGNSVAAYDLLRLAKLTGNRAYEERARALMEYFGGTLNESPMAYTFMLSAALFAKQQGHEIVLAGSPEDETLKEMIDFTKEEFLPFTILLYNKGDEELAGVNEDASLQKAIDGKATVYVCQHFTCQQPITDVAHFKEQFK